MDSDPDAMQRRPDEAFFACRQAFLRRKNALTDQQSSMRDFYLALSNASPGRECGAMAREQLGRDARARIARLWVKAGRHRMRRLATVEWRLPARDQKSVEREWSTGRRSLIFTQRNVMATQR